MSESSDELNNEMVKNDELCCSDISCCPPKNQITRDIPKIGRNDPCICGNGRKFKKCCGKNT